MSDLFHDDLPDEAIAGVAFFFKQWGGDSPRAKKVNGRLLVGREWNEMPRTK